MADFAGTAQPLSQEGLSNASDALGVGLAEIWSVLAVETKGCGFLRDKRPQILFERHVFHRETQGRYDSSAPAISSRDPGGYGSGGAHQYDRLAQALNLDRKAALASASWGIGQVMGNNFTQVGFADVEEMVGNMVASEDAQLRAMFAYCRATGIDAALKARDWIGFARGYNGRGYAKNAYHLKLAQRFLQFKNRGLPVLRVRTAQVYLRYRGFDPGPVDGELGQRTARALKTFQAQNDLAATGTLDDQTLNALRAAATT